MTRTRYRKGDRTEETEGWSGRRKSEIKRDLEMGSRLKIRTL